MELLEAVLKCDSSEAGEICRASCIASLPDAETKERVWNEIVRPCKLSSASVQKAKMANFYHHDQMDIVSPFIDKFFDLVSNDGPSSARSHYDPEEPLSADPMVSNKGKSAFFHGMLPRMGLRNSHLRRLSSMILESEEDEVFKETLRNGSELL